MKKLKVIVIAIVVVVAGGLGVVAYKDRHQTTGTSTNQTVEQSKVVDYDGEEGKTAYDILKAKYNVDATTSSFGVMVNSINGLKATSSEFWLYSVNGKTPDVGADKYVTKTGDKIEWKYGA